MNTLSAEKRDMQIKAKKLRREGFVTGNVFGKNMEGSMPLKIEKKEAERILRTCNKGSQLILTVEGQKMPVLLKEIDYNAMKHEIVEMDFQALVKGEKVHSVAEVVLLNHDKVKSGVVELLLEEISYEALPENLIEKVEIDLTGKQAGDTIRVADLPIATTEGIHLKTNPEETVVQVTEVHNAPEEEETEEAAEEYKRYIEISNLDTLEYQRNLCRQAICLYSTGQTEQPYQMLAKLYNEMSVKKITKDNVEVFVNVLSNLSSIEETLRLEDCSIHFNLALSYAHDYNLTELYYSLLRKSFIVHSGINYMQMLETAKNYYKKNGALKDYAMTIHNQASFYLLNGEVDKVEINCQEAIEIFTEMGSDAVHYTYNCMGMYYCIIGNYHEALGYFRLAYKERYELFSKIVVLLNQTTTHIKLGNYACANQIMKHIECLWTDDEAETFRILKPYHYIIRAELYQKMTNMQEAYKSFMNYFECEDEINDYRFIFAANKFYQLCCNTNRAFPTELKTALKSGNAIAARLLDFDLLPVHLMFAE